MGNQGKLIPLEPSLYRPVISDAAMKFFGSLLKPDFTVFEWGSGGSTIWMAQQVKWIVTVEHNPAWLAEVRRCANEEGLTNIQYLLFHWEDGFPYKDPTRQLYARSILQFPDNHFDLVFSDSWTLARTLCARHVVDKIKPHGWLVADDYEWHPVFNEESAGMIANLGWRRVERHGLCTRQWNHLHHPTTTAFFQKPGDGD